VELFRSNLIVTGIALFLSLTLVHLLYRQERRLGRFISHRLGWRGMLLTGWLGVPIHEFSHLLLAKIFRHRIIGWKLFQPDPVTGTLGYVRHSYNRENAWQIVGCFFVGIAPLFVGGALLALLLKWIFPDVTLPSEFILPSFDSPQSFNLLLQQAWPLLKGVVKALALALWKDPSPWLPLQLYLGLCIASHLAPSGTDLRNGLAGFILFIAISFVAVFWLSKIEISLALVLMLPLALSILLLSCAVFQAFYALTVVIFLRLSRPQGRRASATPKASKVAPLPRTAKSSN
jgi:hypothetical protein